MLTSGDIVFFDLSNLVYRAHYAHSGLETADGRPTSVLFGVPSMILTLLEIAGGAKVVFCFDAGYPNGTQARSFRYDILPEYKGNRKKDADRERATSQLPELYRFLQIAKFPTLACPRLEADDLIGIGTRFVRDKLNGHSYICSGDQDLFQLLSKRCHALRPMKEGGYEIYTALDLFSDTGIRASEWSRYKALAGDASDNIKAIPKVGPVKAKKLLKDGIDPSKADFRRLSDRGRSAHPELRATWTHIHNCFRATYIPRTADYFDGRTATILEEELRKMWSASERTMKKHERLKRARALREWFGDIESGYLSSRTKDFFRGVTVVN